MKRRSLIDQFRRHSGLERWGTIHQLRSLDDRLLADMGIPRHAIGEVVDGHYRMWRE